jgi:uncharacterized protein
MPEDHRLSDPQQTYAAPPPNHVFFGRFGFRAGWGILLFLVIASVLTMMASASGIAATGQLKTILAAQGHPGAPSIQSLIPFVPAFVIVNDGVLFFGMLGACWLISRAESRPLGAYGIGRARRLDILPGAIWGVVSMSVLVALLHSLHFLFIEGRLLHGASILRWGAAWLIAFLLVGLCEEYEFRGYLQYTLMRGVWGWAEQLSPANPHAAAFWIAATIMSLIFGGLHILNGGETVIGILQVFTVGMVFSYALWRTGSLWWGVGFHAIWDWSQSFLFGVADSGNLSVGRLLSTHPAGKTIFSGGSDGPEGSIFSLIFIFLTLFVIRFTTSPGLKPSPEQLPENNPPEHLPLLA